jgi:hypothetical protein
MLYSAPVRPVNALPARVAIECIDDAVVLSRRHFVPLFRLALIPFLVYAGIALFLSDRFTPLGIRVFISVVVYGLYGLLEAATVVGAWDVLHDRPIDFRATWLLVTQHAISVLVATWIRVVAILLGVVFLIFPGIYFLAISFAIPTVNVIEGLGVGASLVRSRSLALGAIKGIALSIGGMWVLLSIVALAIPRLLTVIGVASFSPLRPLCSLAWAGVVVPFRAALAARVYLEVRIRKEGYDLQHIMASLPNSVTAVP